jgi:hypothetical protein
MPPEYLAIGGLFTALSALTGGVIKYLRDENRDLRDENGTLRKQLDVSNEASRDLIRIQAQMLESKGIQVISTGER